MIACCVGVGKMQQNVRPTLKVTSRWAHVFLWDLRRRDVSAATWSAHE